MNKFYYTKSKQQVVRERTICALVATFILGFVFGVCATYKYTSRKAEPHGTTIIVSGDGVAFPNSGQVQQISVQ